MKAEVRPGISGISAGGSRLETWLDMKMHARSRGMRSSPADLDANSRQPATAVRSMKRVPL